MATSAVRSGRGLSRVRQALVDPPGVPERSQLAVGGPTIIERGGPRFADRLLRWSPDPTGGIWNATQETELPG